MVKINFIFKEYRFRNIFQYMTRKMEKEFKKYWKETPLLFVIAIVLDPRAKLLRV